MYRFSLIKKKKFKRYLSIHFYQGNIMIKWYSFFIVRVKYKLFNFSYNPENIHGMNYFYDKENHFKFCEGTHIEAYFSVCQSVRNAMGEIHILAVIEDMQLFFFWWRFPVSVSVKCIIFFREDFVISMKYCIFINWTCYFRFYNFNLLFYDLKIFW